MCAFKSSIVPDHGFLLILYFHCNSSYIHRVGRTARAGREGYAVTFVTDTDRSLLKAIVSFILRGIFAPSTKLTKIDLFDFNSRSY